MHSATVWAGGTFSFSLDNDLYFGTDEEYSNGSLFTYTADEGQAPKFFKTLIEGTLAPDAFQLRYSFGQLIYTPTDIAEDRPLLDQRPYVGLIYGQIDTTFEKGPYVQRLSAVVGIFGPPSIAQQIQNFVHSFRDIQRVNGWGNQISSEPAFNVHYDITRPFHFARGAPINIDFEPFSGFSVGNISTNVRGGFVFRIGPHLGGQPSALSIRTGNEAPRIFRPDGRLRWHIHAGISGKVEAYSSVVEGNIFSSSQSAPERTFQWEGRVGLMTSIGRYWIGVGTNSISRRHDFQRNPFHHIGEIRFGISLF